MNNDRSVRSTTYNETLSAIDEQLCALLKQRKELTNSKTVMPSSEELIRLAENYGFYEEYLKSLFELISHENLYKPRVEPTNFRRYLPVMKSIEIDGSIYSLTFIRQFENASVVHLDIDWHEIEEDPIERLKRNREQRQFNALSIGEEYDCRNIGGSGSEGRVTEKFVISPPLPDNPEGISLTFKQYDDYFCEQPSGFQFEFTIGK